MKLYVWKLSGYCGGPGSRLWEKAWRQCGLWWGLLLLLPGAQTVAPNFSQGTLFLIVIRTYQNQALLAGRVLGP